MHQINWLFWNIFVQFLLYFYNIYLRKLFFEIQRLNVILYLIRHLELIFGAKSNRSQYPYWIIFQRRRFATLELFLPYMFPSFFQGINYFAFPYMIIHGINRKISINCILNHLNLHLHQINLLTIDPQMAQIGSSTLTYPYVFLKIF